jgi:hypothetical protein
MDQNIADRFQHLEARRIAMIDRVRALPSDKQNLKPSPKQFSPVEVIMHMALADQMSADRMNKLNPSELKGLKAKPSFVFNLVVKGLAKAKPMSVPPGMTPKSYVVLDEAAAAWEKAQNQLKGYFLKADGPEEVLQKYFPFGRLSANNILELIEAHQHYHEERFPVV